MKVFVVGAGSAWEWENRRREQNRYRAWKTAVEERAKAQRDAEQVVAQGGDEGGNKPP